MKEQRKFFEASIEFCDRCGNVKDVSQFAGVIHIPKTDEHMAICITCHKDKRFIRLIDFSLYHGTAIFEERKDV